MKRFFFIAMLGIVLSGHARPMACMDQEKEETAEWVGSYADLKRIDQVRRCIYDSFSWRNIDDPEWTGRLVIRFVLTPACDVEDISIRPDNLTPSIREELIRCIKAIDFRKLREHEDASEKIQFIFPYDLFTLMQYESSGLL